MNTQQNTQRWVMKEKAILQEAKNVTQIRPGKIRYDVCYQVLDEFGYNGKKYLRQCMVEGIQQKRDVIETGGLTSEMDHPLTTNENRIMNIEMQNICQRAREISVSGNRVNAICENLSNRLGQDLFNLIYYDKLPIGFSLRAIGDVRPLRDGTYEVFQNLDIVTWDVVSNPSFSEAVIKQVLDDNKFENMRLQESIKFMEAQLHGDTRQVLTESKTKQKICKLVDHIKKSFIIEDPEIIMKYVYRKFYKDFEKKYYVFLR